MPIATPPPAPPRSSFARAWIAPYVLGLIGAWDRCRGKAVHRCEYLRQCILIWLKVPFTSRKKEPALTSLRVFNRRE